MSVSPPAAPGAAADNSPRAEFWNEERKRIFGDFSIQLFNSQSAEERAADYEFLGRTLPTLALHFDGRVLADLKNTHPWLAVLEPSSPSNWDVAKTTFLENGPFCLDILEQYTELVRLEYAIGVIAQKDQTVLTYLLVGLHRALRKSISDDNSRGGGQDVRLKGLSESHMLGLLTAEALENGVTSDRIEKLVQNHRTAEDNLYPFDRTEAR
jgi:hypothetical protein